MEKSIGQKIRELRLQQDLTLKELGRLTRLSVGYLSQLERGLTDISTDLLARVAQSLGVDRAYFFLETYQRSPSILRSYERGLFRLDPSHSVQYQLSAGAGDKALFPRLIELMPLNSNEELLPYGHEGEEFVHVLEGTLTLFIEQERHELFPGDSAHYASAQPHNWANYTAKLTRILVVSLPNPLASSNSPS